MFGSIDKSKGLLFVTHDLDHSIRLTMQNMHKEVEGLDENRLLNTPPEDLKFYLVEKYCAYSTRWRTRLHADGGQCSSVMADAVPR